MRISSALTLIKLLCLMEVVVARPSIELNVGGSFPVSVKAEGQVTALLLFLGEDQNPTTIKGESDTSCVLLCNVSNDTLPMKPKSNSTEEPENVHLPMNCREVQALGRNESGIYTISPYVSSPERHVDVFCDMTTDGGGWTVIQRRGDYETQEDFYRPWDDYTQGFGNLTKDFWIGLDHIHALTNQSLYEARIDLEDFDNEKRFAKYSNFSIDDKTNFFKIQISGFSGDANDSMRYHDGMKFSTWDKDQDGHNTYNCAERYSGAWWYRGCHYSNLNGQYIRGGSGANNRNLIWYHWRGEEYSLKRSEIKIRPRGG